MLLYYDYGVQHDSKTVMCRYFSTPDSEAFSSTVDDPATLTLDQQGSPPAAGALGAERTVSIVHSKGSLSDGVVVGSSLQQLVCAHTTHLSVPAPPVKDVAMLAVLRKPTNLPPAPALDLKPRPNKHGDLGKYG